MIDRIKKFIDNQNISIRSFEQKIGASNGLIRKAIANKTDIQSKWIAAIVENYPQINPEWLLTGKGEMLTNNTQNNSGLKKNIFSSDDNDAIEAYIADAFATHLLEMYETGRVYPATMVKLMLEEKNMRIKELEKEIYELQRKLDQQNHKHDIEERKKGNL